MNRKQKMKIAGQIGLVVLGIIVIYLIVMLIDNRIGIFDSGEDEDESYEEEELPIEIDGQEYELAHDMKTYLIMGTDNSGNEEAEDRDSYDGSMADFMLLVVVDDTDQTYRYIQLNRDTITKVPLLQKDHTAYASADIQMCVSHAYGGSKEEGCENTVRTVSMFLHGIPIDGYYAMKMEAIPELNHAVGGVTVTIEDDFTEIDPEMKPGATLKLSDEQAYTFVHSRMDVGDGQNTSRMRRHRTYMEALAKTVQEQAAKDKKYVNRIYKELMSYSTTDMGSKSFSNIASKINSYTDRGLVTPEGETKVGVSEALADGLEHTEFYADEDALVKLIRDTYPLTKVGDTEDGEE